MWDVHGPFEKWLGDLCVGRCCGLTWTSLCLCSILTAVGIFFLESLGRRFVAGFTIRRAFEALAGQLNGSAHVSPACHVRKVGSYKFD